MSREHSWARAAAALLVAAAVACAGRAGSAVEPAPARQADAAEAQATPAAALTAPQPPQAAHSENATPADAAPDGAGPAAVFAETVQPILSRRCGKCHDPGGRMYDRLPFDNAQVVRDHRAGILGRLNDPAEKRTVEDWLLLGR